MVAPNSVTLGSQSPFTLFCSPTGHGLPIRTRVSNASIDKLAARSGKRSAAKAAPLKAVKKGATKAKAVRFSEASKVIIDRNAAKQSTEEEKAEPNATWYQNRDYAIIKYEILASIKAITKVFKNESTSPLDLEQHCLRGIETSISSDLYLRRKHRIRSTLKGVLEHQRLQRLAGLSDPNALRNVSLKQSEEAQESAFSVGKLDACL